ncbi:MAG: hypothetical protein JRI23_07805 [Deltaproteobacteria bacterium]|jgi:hypothetical protein|nr:hypothetical protein [Deltaproteobacteria bacterium]MBW2531510.1 hypothetical protein [Deltaproteobacteria bacterium]
MRPSVDALSARYSGRATIDGKIKTFVQAAKDMAAVSQQIEAEATGACIRIGQDLGMTPAQLRPQSGPGGSTAGACNAVAARIDGILQQGVRLQATVQPPQCQANMDAQARCASACNVGIDNECNASCQAHANAQASCSPAQVTVQATQNAQLAGRLVQSLQANLPQLIHAQITLGQRLMEDARIVAQVGAELPKIVGDAGAQAAACIAAAAEASATASVRIQVSVRASASVSGRAGAG